MPNRLANNALPLACVLGALFLTACGGDDSPAPPPTPPPPTSPVWTFQFSPGMGVANTYGSGGFSFIFPSTDGVHYLIKQQNTPLSQSINLSYVIDAPPTAVFDYRTNPDNNCGPGYPGTVQPYFHMAADSTFANEFGRWFGWGYKEELKAGSFNIGAPFYSAPENWISVYGKNGKDYLVQFQTALSNVAEVGVVFGGGCFAGHGVFVTGGTATMNASIFSAQ